MCLPELQKSSDDMPIYSSDDEIAPEEQSDEEVNLVLSDNESSDSSLGINKIIFKCIQDVYVLINIYLFVLNN